MRAIAVFFLATASLFAAPTGTAAYLADAAEQGDRAAVRELIAQGSAVDAAQVDGMTALHWAAYRDDLETAQLLIAAKANVEATNRYGVSPLSLAATNGNAVMIKALLDAGADANTMRLGGETVLMTAARTGKADAVRVLLAHGADPNQTASDDGQTALMWAAAEGHAETVQELLRGGADLNARLPSGFTATFLPYETVAWPRPERCSKLGLTSTKRSSPRQGFGAARGLDRRCCIWRPAMGILNWRQCCWIPGRTRTRRRTVIPCCTNLRKSTRRLAETTIPRPRARVK